MGIESTEDGTTQDRQKDAEDALAKNCRNHPGKHLKDQKKELSSLLVHRREYLNMKWENFYFKKRRTDDGKK